MKQFLEFVGGTFFGLVLDICSRIIPVESWLYDLCILHRGRSGTRRDACDPTRTVGVYGDVDTGCTFALRGLGARVFIAVCDPICAGQARVECLQVAVESAVLVSIDRMTSCIGSLSWLSTESATTLGSNCDLRWNQ